MLRDTLAPLAAFYVLWKTVGLAAGVLAALAVGLVALYFAKREGRPGAFVRVVLAIVLFRAAVGLIGHSTFDAVFTRITVVWGVAFLVRAVARLLVLLTGSVDRYVAFAVIVDVGFLVGLLTWSISYSMRRFRRTEQWERLYGATPSG